MSNNSSGLELELTNIDIALLLSQLVRKASIIEDVKIENVYNWSVLELSEYYSEMWEGMPFRFILKKVVGKYE